MKKKGTTKYKVKETSRKVLHDFDGMNAKAAKQLSFKPKLKKNEILVVKGLSKNKKKAIIEHEKKESTLMNKGEKYWQAHVAALKKKK